MASFIEYGGQRWYRNRGGYYRNREGYLLHRYMYECEVGPIPDGFDIHHVDGDPGRNEVGNLEPCSRSDHVRKHPPRGVAAMGRDERSAKAAAEWVERSPRKRQCLYCGGEFFSIGQRATTCGKLECVRARQREANQRMRDKKRSLAGPPPKRELRPYLGRVRACVVCGDSFRAPDPRTECCSRECGYICRSQRKADRAD
jgi:hypothetical protein